MAQPAHTPPAEPILKLGIDGFSFEDLYSAQGLRRLAERFDRHLEAQELSLSSAFLAHRTGQARLSGPAESELLLRVANHLSSFIGKLFNLTGAQEDLASHLKKELQLFEFKREFVTRRVFKKGAADRPTADELPKLDERMQVLLQLGFPSSKPDDLEGDLAEAVLTLMRFERLFSASTAPSGDELGLRQEWAKLRAALLSSEAGKSAFGTSLLPQGDDSQELLAVRALLHLADRWIYARSLHPEHKKATQHWATLHLPKALNFEKLVELKFPNPEMPEAMEGPDSHLRRRQGFQLTDNRMDHRHIMNEVAYCVICHEREKDSCSKGFVAKDAAAEGHSYKKNALGIPLTGCPLDERISEAHALKSQGDVVGALAMVMVDNPMCPGTGHRICNDCMKACIFQKQEPVNIPEVETSTLTDVLNLPWGFEIFSLFQKWNPLNIRRPFALPYLGKNVLVVGLGPAGYTLSHYLLNEGFGVVGIDGLKIEPFPDELTGRNGHPLKPIFSFQALTSSLDQRILSGFGGVSEYGITVRWDKNFLSLIHLALARRDNLRIYGGIRFGGTLTIDDAWELGFDHIAIAAGAGKPTLIPIKNNLIRGIRKASDFLMSLQLTGAFKRDSLANLQVQLPAVVIGGGLTAIDTATELMAYYPIQVEKTLERFEKLAQESSESELLAKMDPEDRTVLLRFLEHGKAVKAERVRAEKAGELPNLAALVRQWGGVSLCYRRTLNDSPAYRLNHEEVSKALEEGIRFIERVSPLEAVPDEFGAVQSMKFDRMAMIEGKLRSTGKVLEIAAKTVCVAAGTSPNVTYEKEYPGTFEMDEDQAYFKSFHLVENEGALSLVPAEVHEDLARPVGFFTSYSKNGKFISYYGDNHPTYAGNVVKAMASAKDGYPDVARLFAKEFAQINVENEGEERKRRQHLASFFTKLDEAFLATVVAVHRLTPTIVEVVCKAPFAAKHFQPGQFYRLQNFESTAPVVDGTKLVMEGLALTGAWVDREKGLMSTVVLEMGASTRMCAMLKPGQPIVLMGPTGAPTEIPSGETVLLAGGGLGNAVLFSIGQALKAAGSKVLYFAAYRSKADIYKMDELEAAADQIIWSVDAGECVSPRRPQDASFQGNIVQAMVAYAEGRLNVAPVTPLKDVQRLIAIGSDRMMKAVRDARHSVLKPHLSSHCEAIGSINSPMQCMMKEICAQCLQKHVDPVTGKETVVFSCFNQDQKLDWVDFGNLNSRLRTNHVMEKLSNWWLDRLFRLQPELKRI